MAGQGELVQLYTGLRLDTALTWPLPRGAEAAKRWGVWDPGSQGALARGTLGLAYRWGRGSSFGGCRGRVSRERKVVTAWWT